MNLIKQNLEATHFEKQNSKFVFEKRVPKPARIPPQTPPAGGKSAEAGRILSPRQIVSPCRVRISIFNHLDSARNSFELCPTNTATIYKSLSKDGLYRLFFLIAQFVPAVPASH